jgi:eukaryotic-like serine/threonine-protein kinase
MADETDLCGIVIDGRYQVVERMAEGAMGVVYRGVRTKLNRAVAIKVMHAALPAAMAARERFEREANLMALLEHPHCVSVIDYGLHGDKPYVVMELVRGRSLHELIAEQGRFAIPRATDIVRQVLSGLAHAHEHGIIHRDVKPANIMITPKAPLGVHVRLLDFGLARMYGSNGNLSDGIAVGTPSYMAPEQCRGDKLDERVDLYACGVVLFELVAGRKPFVANDPIEIVKKHLEQPPPRLKDVTTGAFGALEAVVARALAKAPGDRFPNAVAMSEAIDAAVGGRALDDTTPGLPVHELGSREVALLSTSAQVSITLDSAVRRRDKSDAKTGIFDPHDTSMLRRMLPVSRLRWMVLSCALVIGAAAYAVYSERSANDVASAPAPTPALVVTAGVDAGVIVPVDRISENVAPTRVPPPVVTVVVDAGVIAPVEAANPSGPAIEAYAAGRTYFARRWWADGIQGFRRAIDLEPSYRHDETLLRMVTQGFATTPGYNDKIGSFLLWLGPPTVPYLDELARTHHNPEVRVRCAAMSRRLGARAR